MCGIVGIVNLGPQRPVDEALLKRMRDVLSHRGPDGAGIWIDGPVGLGHRRLAIVDVAGGRQPMSNEACAGQGNGTVWITYNGEIYNHSELRRELQAKGHRYRSRSDTETILHLYEEEGERCVEKLRGMFAFAIWDQKLKRLLLARDRLGIKPLYYAVTDDALVFASEIKGILAGDFIRPSFNEAVLPQFLANRFVSGEETFFRGIRKLLPGRVITWSAEEGLHEERYWRLPAQNGYRGDLEECAADVRARLEAVVRSHLMSDVPLGVFLSGGIDSSGVAALMASMAKEPIRTFSVGFAEPGANELPYARLVAQAVGAEHHEVLVSPEEFFRALPRLIWHEDEPIAFTSSVPLYFVSRLAQEHVKVVLTGEGADELFLGYPWYRVTLWNERLGRPYFSLVPEQMRAGIGKLIRRLPYRARRYAERSFLALGPGPRGLFYENFAVFSAARQEDLLTHRELLTARDPYAEELRCYLEGGDGTLGRMSHADLQTYLVELLMKQDQMSMAASIESRVPFLDHEFVEYVTALPDRFKLRGWRTKAVLREALERMVPRAILTRGKMGFPVPVGGWFRGLFSSIVDEFVLGPRTLQRGFFNPLAVRRLAEEHRAGAAEHGDRLWLLANLEIWQRIFLDGEDIAAVTKELEQDANPVG